MVRLFIGLMSGTSVDAIDTVLVDFSQPDAHLVAHFSQPIDRELKSEINRIISIKAWPQETKALDERFVQASSQAIHHLLDKAAIGADQVEAVGSHGQTVFHNPSGTPPASIQIGNGGQIARVTGIKTVGNFRQADIAVGGQGAPLACAYHARLFRHEHENRAVINLGGIANITFLPADQSLEVKGFDTGPANTLSDTWVQHCRGHDFDQAGNWAQSGAVNRNLLDQMLKEPYFRRPPPKSTGRETFSFAWLQSMLDQYGEPLEEKDVQATLVELTAQSVTQAIKEHPLPTIRILLCGGGTSNTYLVSRIEHAIAGVSVESTDAYGIPSKWLEAMTFAWLAKQAVDGKSGNLPSVTGASQEVVLGKVYLPD